MKDILLKDLTKFVEVESRVVPGRVILGQTLGHFCLVEKSGHKLKIKDYLRHSFIIYIIGSRHKMSRTYDFKREI